MADDDYTPVGIVTDEEIQQRMTALREQLDADEVERQEEAELVAGQIAEHNRLPPEIEPPEPEPVEPQSEPETVPIPDGQETAEPYYEPAPMRPIPDNPVAPAE